MELPWYISFLGGSLCGGFADFVTYPFDLMKTRYQMRGTQGLPRYNGVIDCFKQTHRTGGLKEFYMGFTPALIRQVFSSGLKICLYDSLRKTFGASDTDKWARFVYGGISGGLAALSTTPLDVVKVRLANNVGRQYSGMVDCLSQAYSREGLKGFYKGSSPNTLRAVVVTGVELGVFDLTKDLLVTLGLSDSSLTNWLISSANTGVVVSVCISPIEVVRSRYMNVLAPDSSKVKDSQPRYLSPLDCFKKILRHEGPGAFFAGLPLLWMRLGPWCTLFYVAREWFNAEATTYYEHKKTRDLLRGKE
jgi:solute carrier family 25 uncoupling protein 27